MLILGSALQEGGSFQLEYMDSGLTFSSAHAIRAILVPIAG
jgi:hypothetical protein